MATAPKMMAGGESESGRRRSASQLRKDQLWKDRLVGLLALLFIAGLMALMIWLASLGQAPIGIDAFPMMP